MNLIHQKLPDQDLVVEEMELAYRDNPKDVLICIPTQEKAPVDELIGGRLEKLRIKPEVYRRESDLARLR